MNRNAQPEVPSPETKPKTETEDYASVRTKAAEAMERARSYVLRAMPYYYETVGRFKYIPTEHATVKVRTTREDGTTVEEDAIIEADKTLSIDAYGVVRYSPDYVLKCSLEELGFAILHENGHYLMNHFERSFAMEPHLKSANRHLEKARRHIWMVALELEVNDLIQRKVPTPVSYIKKSLAKQHLFFKCPKGVEEFTESERECWKMGYALPAEENFVKALRSENYDKVLLYAKMYEFVEKLCEHPEGEELRRKIKEAVNEYGKRKEETFEDLIEKVKNEVRDAIEKFGGGIENFLKKQHPKDNPAQEQERTAAPGQEQTAAPGQEQTAAPGQEQAAAPGQEQTAAPGQGQTAAPGQGQVSQLSNTAEEAIEVIAKQLIMENLPQFENCGKEVNLGHPNPTVGEQGPNQRPVAIPPEERTQVIERVKNDITREIEKEQALGEPVENQGNKGMGHGAWGVLRALEKVRAPQVSLETLLRNVVGQYVKNGNQHSSHRAFSPLQPYYDKYLPTIGLKSPILKGKISEEKRIGFIVDTSGSMSGTKLGQGCDILVKLLSRNPNVKDVVFMSIDTQVHEERIVAKRDIPILPSLFKGNGGSSLVEAFERMNQYRDVELTFVITDMAIEFPEKEPPYKTVILSSDERTDSVPNWAELIKIEEPIREVIAANNWLERRMGW